MKNHLTFSILIVILFSGLFISCGTESEPFYGLTTSVNGDGVITPSGGVYEEGETVTLTAIPAKNWVFKNWRGDVTGGSRTITFTMDSNKNVIANFGRNFTFNQNSKP